MLNARLKWIGLSFSIILVLSSNVGCSDVDYKNPTPDIQPPPIDPPGPLSVPKPPTPDTPVLVEPPPKLAVVIKALDQPNAYYAVLNFTDLSAGDWVVKRKKEGERDLHVIELKESLDGIEDRTVEAASTYTYQLAKSDETKLSDPITVKIPRDFAIGGIQSMATNPQGKIEIAGFERLFLHPESTILTQGRDLSIDVNEIISSNGEIRTFSETQQATLGQDGRSGGSITIHAKKLIGTSSIALRGERGGQGQKGSRGEKGLKGPRGAPQTGHLNIGLSHYCGGAAVKFMRERYEDVWLKHPARGGKGGQGDRGYQGYQGLRGGDSASLLAEIPLLDLKNISLSIEPGKGGTGGQGGDGGAGGDGGSGGTLNGHDSDCGTADPNYYNCCPTPPIGPSGDQGIEGPAGPEGQTGKRSVITINSQVLD